MCIRDSIDTEFFKSFHVALISCFCREVAVVVVDDANIFAAFVVDNLEMCIRDRD